MSRTRTLALLRANNDALGAALREYHRAVAGLATWTSISQYEAIKLLNARSRDPKLAHARYIANNPDGEFHHNPPHSQCCVIVRARSVPGRVNILAMASNAGTAGVKRLEARSVGFPLLSRELGRRPCTSTRCVSSRELWLRGITLWDEANGLDLTSWRRWGLSGVMARGATQTAPARGRDVCPGCDAGACSEQRAGV